VDGAVEEVEETAPLLKDGGLVLLLGELVEIGETEALFSQPRDKRTEDYITGRFG